MKNTFLENLILSKTQKLSKTEERIAEYFISEGIDITSKTLSEMSNELSISKSSIYNFITKLAFEGVQDFKIAVATNSTANDEDIDERKITVFSDVSETDSPDKITNKVVQSNISSLERLKHEIDQKQLEKANSILNNTELLHFAGLGGSSTIAFNSYHKFMRAPIRCNYISDYHMQLGNATKLTEKDTLIIFSHSGDTKETNQIAKTAKEYGAKIIILTGNPFCKLVHYADAYFIVSSEEALFKSESLNSQIIYMTIIDIIYVSFILKNKDKSTTSIQNIRKTLE